MGLFDVFKNKHISYHKESEEFESLVPAEILEKCNDNLYLNKYKENSINEIVYLLYCDYATSFRWVKDSNNPKTYFENCISSIKILKALLQYSNKYKFSNPTPDEQLTDLYKNYSNYTNNFLKRFWNLTFEKAHKLKTEKAKAKKYQDFFDTLSQYNSYFTNENLNCINNLKKNIGTEESLQKSDIVKIPIVSKHYDNPVDEMRALQKQATEHKRNGDIELAIDCLRKSNKISDSLDMRNRLLPKEYLRLVKYLKNAGLIEEAKAEEDNINRIHPEFSDQRISNLIYIKEVLEDCNKYNNDLVQVCTNNHCPVCRSFNNKIYSISGRTKGYKKIPNEIINYGGFCKQCHLTLLHHFEDDSE